MPTAPPRSPEPPQPSGPSGPSEPGPPRRAAGRRLRLLAIGGVVVAALLVGGLRWYATGDAPAAVDIGSAADAIAGGDAGAATAAASEAAGAEAPATAGTTGTAGPAPTTAPATGGAAAGGDLSGEWAVDTSIGEFSVEGTTGTFVGFRVAEVLSGIGEVEAVGRTPEVSGLVVVDGTTLTSAEITADLTAIASDEQRREGAIQRALGTDTAPTATFTATGPVELGSDLAEGEVVAVEVPGTLTVNAVSRDVVAPLEVTRTGDTVVVTGSLDVTFADHGVEVPSAPIVVSVEDHGQVELQLYLTRS